MSLLKGVIIFFAGAVTGAVPASFYFKKRYEKLADAEILSMQEYYEHKQNRSLSRPAPQNREPSAYRSSDTPVVENGTPRSSIDRQRRSNRRKIDYTTYYDPKEAAGNDEPVFSTEEVTGETLAEEAEKNRGREPRLIKQEDYGEIESYDTVSLLYNPDEDVLENELEEEYEDLDEVYSELEAALSKYDFKHSDEKRIYVRDFKRQTDYEITKIPSSFREGST